MRQFIRFPGSSGILFIRLLSGFLIVILLLLSFHLFSFYYLKDRYHEKLIKYNQLNLDYTIDSYEDLFSASKNVLLGFYNGQQINLLSSEMANTGMIQSQTNVNELYKSLAEVILANPHLYLENIYLVIQDSSSVISKSGVSSRSLLFSKFMDDKELSPNFWDDQFKQSYTSRIFPISLYVSKEQSDQRTPVFAMIVKNRFMPNIYIVAFINMGKAYQHYSHFYDGDFWIMAPDGSIVYDSAPLTSIPKLSPNEKSYVYSQHYYYFNKTGLQTGLTYTNRVPEITIKAEISQLNLYFIIALSVAIAISVAISILFSLSINNPVKKIMAYIQVNSLKKPVQGKIREFEDISEHLLNMKDKLRQSDMDVKELKTSLKSYAYANQLKSIKSKSDSLNHNFSSLPFVFIMTQLHFRKVSGLLSSVNPEHAASFIREYIDLVLSEHYAESFTLQMEIDQITSLIFLGTSTRDEIVKSLEPVKKVLDLDADICLMTFGISSVYEHSSELTQAYEEAQNLTKQRHLQPTTQIISESTGQWHFTLSSQQENELHAHLMSANREAVSMWVQRILGLFEHKHALAEQVHQCAWQIILKVKQLAHSMNLPETPYENSLEDLAYCFTYSDYETILTQVVNTATNAIEVHKEEQDGLINFVIDYLEKHYNKEISLDILASHLKISSGYLSSYFKEKTGGNFKDYITKIRMEKAMVLLKNSDNRIQEISERVGYPNLNPFIRMFKKYTGLTPGEYRKKYLS